MSFWKIVGCMGVVALLAGTAYGGSCCGDSVAVVESSTQPAFVSSGSFVSNGCCDVQPVTYTYVADTGCCCRHHHRHGCSTVAYYSPCGYTYVSGHRHHGILYTTASVAFSPVTWITGGF